MSCKANRPKLFTSLDHLPTDFFPDQSVLLPIIDEIIGPAKHSTFLGENSVECRTLIALRYALGDIQSYSNLLLAAAFELKSGANRINSQENLVVGYKIQPCLDADLKGIKNNSDVPADRDNNPTIELYPVSQEVSKQLDISLLERADCALAELTEVIGDYNEASLRKVFSFEKRPAVKAEPDSSGKPGKKPSKPEKKPPKKGLPYFDSDESEPEDDEIEFNFDFTPPVVDYGNLPSFGLVLAEMFARGKGVEDNARTRRKDGPIIIKHLIEQEVFPGVKDAISKKSLANGLIRAADNIHQTAYRMGNGSRLVHVAWIYTMAVLAGWGKVIQLVRQLNVWSSMPTAYRGTLPSMEQIIKALAAGGSGSGRKSIKRSTPRSYQKRGGKMGRRPTSRPGTKRRGSRPRSKSPCPK